MNDMYEYMIDDNIETAIKHILKTRLNNPMITESYEPIDGIEKETNIEDFTMRLNCNT
jgi:hypothetical protein